MPIGRRSFLVGSVGAAAAVLGAGRSAAAIAAPAHRLSFYHVHTAEKLTVTYREHGVLIPQALDRDQSLPARLSQRADSRHRRRAARLPARPLRHVRRARQLRDHFRLPLTANERGAAARDLRRRRKQPPYPRPSRRRALDERQDRGTTRRGACAESRRRRLLSKIEFRPRRHGHRPRLVVPARRAIR